MGSYCMYSFQIAPKDTHGGQPEQVSTPDVGEPANKKRKPVAWPLEPLTPKNSPFGSNSPQT